jgi:hypothetical protein
LTLDEFFTGFDESRPIFDALRGVAEAIGPVELRVSKSQIAFRHRIAFAWAWIPDRYLHGRHAPLVLSVAFPYRHPSPRWKEIVEPVPGRFMHHLELRAETDIDDEVRAWLTEAWTIAG